MIDLIAVWLLLISFAIVFLVFVGYPLTVFIAAKTKRNQTVNTVDLPSVSMLVAVRNGEKLIADKIENCLSLDYPKDKIDFIFFSDGSSDQTLAILKRYQAENSSITVLFDDEHIGKAKALNQARLHARGDVLVFSDADAILVSDSITHLVSAMVAQNAAGACGQRALKKAEKALKQSQKTYIEFDSWIKLQESKLGYLTSNDGKLYAVLKSIHQDIAEGVTDDLYSALNVIAKGHKFVFAPNAVAHIKTPSRNEKHEISRRRRITCRSFTGIFMFSQLLNPLKYGSFAIALFCNKVLRRMLPLALVLFLLASLMLTATHPLWMLLVLVQLVFYAIAIVTPLIQPGASRVGKLMYAIHYFVLGNLGMLLGVWDFITNKKVIKWEPVKND